jgi:anti-sigma-K factor RskA
MNCEQVAELLPAYALHAVSEEERAEIEAHLETCDLHAEALAFERVAARLPDAIEEREPPADLRARILAASRSTAPAQESGIPMSTGQRSSPRRPRIALRGSRFAPRSAPRFAPYAIAAALVLVIGFVTLNALGSDGDSITRSASSNGLSTTLVYNAGSQSADVSFEGLPALDSEHAYQLWTIGPGAAPVSAGVLIRNDDGTAEQSLSGTFEDGTTFAITVEPAGGSQQPTTDPLIATTL